MRNAIIILLILLTSCKTKQVIVRFTDLRDSTRMEVIATPRVANKWIQQTEQTQRTLISSVRRSSIVSSKNDLKQAVSDNKTKQRIVESDNTVKKVEARQEAAVEKKQIQSEIVKSKKLPNTIKWIAVLVIALIVGWIIIKKKIPFLG